MPIYEYQCEACGHQMEALQRMSDAPLTSCPSCEQPQLRKKISAAGFRLKGSGWYETDFKAGNKKNLAGDTAKPAAKSEASSGSATETG
ncbi:FmdB family zinc ribbon protein [Microbulbifer sp. 2201CG32-9]|uniref:FmdB family zinc ribbon protein n=1 Tax=Microbulbifer sp. 2201CG32-9 TaxID=3232309 RepID=UPI00345B7B53